MESLSRMKMAKEFSELKNYLVFRLKYTQTAKRINTINPSLFHFSDTAEHSREKKKIFKAVREKRKFDYKRMTNGLKTNFSSTKMDGRWQ